MIRGAMRLYNYIIINNLPFSTCTDVALDTP